MSLLSKKKSVCMYLESFKLKLQTYIVLEINEFVIKKEKTEFFFKKRSQNKK